jgi:hypothetical protein
MKTEVALAATPRLSQPDANTVDAELLAGVAFCVGVAACHAERPVPRSGPHDQVS